MPNSCNLTGVPPRGRPPNPLPKKVPPLEQRIRLLCKRHGVSPINLGINAGLKADAVPDLIAAARAGEAEPGRVKTFLALARFYDVTVEWFFAPGELPEKSWK